MMRTPDIFLPRDGALKMLESNADHGDLTLMHIEAEDFFVVRAIEIGPGVRIPVETPAEYKVLHWEGPLYKGQWMRRASDDINIQHRLLINRPGHVIPFDDFRAIVPGVEDPGAATGVLVTHDPDMPEDLRTFGVAEYAGWLIRRSGVSPVHLELEPLVLGIDQLEGKWPLAELKSVSAMVVGCGSIGSAAAEALARFGVGRLVLVDPDRLRWHNPLRHTLGAGDVGSYKVSGLSRELGARWPTQAFVPHRLDVVSEAHQVRPLLEDVDIVLCAADGIAARRVMSHLARRAKKPSVLAAVLEAGGIGEIIRLRPTSKYGCLLCLRAHLSASGAMDAEAVQELDYGTGRVHLPMTAVPPDLHLTGIFAAKVAVATMLESRFGDGTQRIPDEHALLGFRSTSDLAPPFNLDKVGEVMWHSIPPPRPDCPTCNP